MYAPFGGVILLESGDRVVRPGAAGRERSRLTCEPPMTVLSVTCHNCQTILDLHPRDLVLALPPVDQGEEDPEVLYGIEPCGYADAAAIEWRLAANLALEGTTVLRGFKLCDEAPLELTDPARTQARPLSLDDLLDRHEQLSQLDQHGIG
jgi:hypothetical protein